MGWMRTLMLGNIGTQMNVADVSTDVGQLRHKLATLRAQQQRSEHADRTHDAQLAALRAENDELRLFTAELARLLVSKGTITETELHGITTAIDRD